MRSYLIRWLLPRCSPLPDVRGGHDFDAAPASTHALRSIHEWCCSPISLISSGCASDARGCLCQRTTESEDGTTLSAVKRARCFLSRANSLLWSSMPCTGGSSWQRINVKKPGGYARLRKHIRLFDKLWHRFETIARHTHQKGNFIAIEWPKGCSYWKLPKVRKLIKDLDLKFVYFDGCMLGLKSIVNGLPIRKPWAICTNSDEILKEFSGLTCCGHSKHQPCQGVDTKITEGYTVEFVDKLHSAWRRECSSRHS